MDPIIDSQISAVLHCAVRSGLNGHIAYNKGFSGLTMRLDLLVFQLRWRLEELDWQSVDYCDILG